MPYCMFFKGGFAMHGSSGVPGYNASHGCVRLFVDDAQWLNQDFADIGTQVIILPYPSSHYAQLDAQLDDDDDDNDDDIIGNLDDIKADDTKVADITFEVNKMLNEDRGNDDIVDTNKTSDTKAGGNA